MKKNLNLEQLVKDGFVQLKTKRQLLKQGILVKSEIDPMTKGYAPFHKTKATQTIIPSMLESLGKIIPIDSGSNYSNQVFNSLGWPIECVQR